MSRTITDREARAIAYQLADEIETIADRIKREQPNLSYAWCQSLALLELL